jgi:hypothetical protein
MRHAVGDATARIVCVAMLLASLGYIAAAANLPMQSLLPLS